MTADKKEFTISRVFNAPRELVFQAWTVPVIMAKWWGPKGFAVQSCTMDFRPGGTYHYCMKGPDGKDMWGKFVYREIKPFERLVYVNSFSDEKGGLTRHPFSPTWPQELLSTISFDEENGGTRLTIHWVPVNASDVELKTFSDGMASMEQGWGGTLDQLTAYLEKAQNEQAA